MRPDLPSIFELRNLGPALDYHPRVHPNGFIQLDLSDILRLHVWHPGLPYRQKTYHPVHDHVFDFTSYVYSGRLVHVAYDAVLNASSTHVLWTAECIGPNESVLRPTADRVRLVQVNARAVQPGEEYFFAAHEFHETLSNEPTLTIIRKNGATIYQGNDDVPSIAVPFGVEPDNDFRRDNVDVDTLWKLIEEAHP